MSEAAIEHLDNGWLRECIGITKLDVPNWLIGGYVRLWVQANDGHPKGAAFSEEETVSTAASAGQRRKFWSWGYEGQDIPESDVKSMHERVAKRLNMTDFSILKDPTLDEIEIRAPRIKPPASL